MHKSKKIRIFGAKLRDNEKNPEDIAYQVLHEVIIPNVFRDDYILALKKFSHQRDISTLVQVLDKMQQYAGRIPCGSFEEAHEYLTLTNAYKEPDEARLIM